MDLTPANKAHIDGLSYHALLSRWRHGRAGDPWFTGETGTYWGQRLAEMRDLDPEAAVQASKDIGWDT